MKRLLAILLALTLILCAGCDFEREEKDSSGKGKDGSLWDSLTTEPSRQQTEPTEPSTTEPTQTRQTQAPTQPKEPEKPTHSPYYISGVDTDTMLRYFSEVALDAEFINSGNATLVQKWNDSAPGSHYRY